MIHLRLTSPSGLRTGETFRTPAGRVVFVHTAQAVKLTYKGAAFPVASVRGWDLAGHPFRGLVPDTETVIARRASRG